MFIARRKLLGVFSALTVFVVVATVNHYLYLEGAGGGGGGGGEAAAAAAAGKRTKVKPKEKEWFEEKCQLFVFLLFSPVSLVVAGTAEEEPSIRTLWLTRRRTTGGTRRERNTHNLSTQKTWFHFFKTNFRPALQRRSALTVLSLVVSTGSCSSQGRMTGRGREGRWGEDR